MIRAIQFQNKRVGSTFLQKAINSHPDIMGIDEVFVNQALQKGLRKSGFIPFVKSDISNAGKYIKEVINKKHPNKNTIFKLMYHQTHHNNLLNYITNEKIPIIFLERRNIVKQIISYLNRVQYNEDTVVISPDDLMAKIKEYINLNDHWKNKLKANIKLTLYYEDIIGDKEFKGHTLVSSEACHAICSFFNVKYIRLVSPTKKKNKEDISVYLPNIEDIRKRFKNTEYEWMIKGE